MLDSISDLPSHITVREIADYTDTTSYPEYEDYLITEYDKNFDGISFEEYAKTIYFNPAWDGTKLEYFMEAVFKYLKDTLAIELDQIYDFFDPYFLKKFSAEEVTDVYKIQYYAEKILSEGDTVTVNRSGNILELEVFEVVSESEYVVVIKNNPNDLQEENIEAIWVDIDSDRVIITKNARYQNVYNAYYERFFELFESYVSYLNDFLNIFESSDTITNVEKKDLLIYFGKKIYEYRGTEKGFTYLKNIFNPLYYKNKFTGDITAFPIDIQIDEVGEFETSVSDEKLPYVYGLTLSNISNSDVKISLINLIDNLLHPTGYNANVTDYVQFFGTLKLNTTLYSGMDKEVLHAYYLGNDGSESLTASETTYSEYNDVDDFVDLTAKNYYTINDGQDTFDFTYGD